MNPEKAKLRSGLKHARLELSDADHTLRSRAINKRLKEGIDWSAVKTVHYFEPIRELLEVDVSGLVTYLEDNYPDIQLFTPRKINNVWETISIKDKKPPEQFDVIIVPMLGFDPKTLHRIGYGGGYYDKFLATQPNAKKVGVCFDTGRVDRILTEPHDIPLDTIVTEALKYCPKN